MDVLSTHEIPVQIKETPQGTTILNGRDKWWIATPGTFGNTNLTRVLHTDGEPGNEKTTMYEANTTQSQLQSLVIYNNVPKNTDLTRPVDNVAGEVLVQNGLFVGEKQKEGLYRGWRDAIAGSLQQRQLGTQLAKLGPDFTSSLTNLTESNF